MKEYRIMQLVTEGPHKGEWKRAWYPNGGPLVHPFKTQEDAQAWIDRMPEWYEKWNRMYPREKRREVPQYRIEVREVTPWEVIA